LAGFELSVSLRFWGDVNKELIRRADGPGLWALKKAGLRSDLPAVFRASWKAVISSDTVILKLKWLNRPAEKMHKDPKKPL
jgi:hypothetical protein